MLDPFKKSVQQGDPEESLIFQYMEEIGRFKPETSMGVTPTPLADDRRVTLR